MVAYIILSDFWLNVQYCYVISISSIQCLPREIISLLISTGITFVYPFRFSDLGTGTFYETHWWQIDVMAR